MDEVTIRYQEITDAQRFLEILSNPHFIYFPAKPASLQEEIEFLVQNPSKRAIRREFNYAILYNGTLVGAVGVQINPYFPYIGALGYFIDEACWGKNIAARAAGELERTCFRDLGLTRIEIIMAVSNTGSERVAQKLGYEEEGLLRKRLLVSEVYHDCYMYAKVL